MEQQDELRVVEEVKVLEREVQMHQDEDQVRGQVRAVGLLKAPPMQKAKRPLLRKAQTSPRAKVGRRHQLRLRPRLQQRLLRERQRRDSAAADSAVVLRRAEAIE